MNKIEIEKEIKEIEAEIVFLKSEALNNESISEKLMDLEKRVERLKEKYSIP